MNLFISSLFSSVMSSKSSINNLQSKKDKKVTTKKPKYKISYHLHGSPYLYEKVTDEEPNEMELDNYSWSFVEKI